MVDTSIIGAPIAPTRVSVERGPVSVFAASVLDTNPIYSSPEAARAAGFADIPAPPTYAFSGLGHWGTFAEAQPDGADLPNPMMGAIGGLMAKGGMVLHGEQEFRYHGAILVGDTLTTSGAISQAYEKESSNGKTMTFVSTETEYRNQRDELVLTSITTLIHRA